MNRTTYIHMCSKKQVEQYRFHGNKCISLLLVQGCRNGRTRRRHTPPPKHFQKYGSAKLCCCLPIFVNATM